MFTMSPKHAKNDRNVTPQKVVSFKTFEAKEKSKVKMAYPFLSPEQIKGKIKDRWNKLRDDEKQNYTTYKLERTPQGKSHKQSTYKKQLSTKRRSACNLMSPKAKEPKLDVCDTPEYLNSQKLFDFRSSHQETYRNDFPDNSPSRESPSSVFADKITPYRSCGNIGLKLRTPICERETTQGILKNSDSAKKLCKPRVSFNSPMEVNTFNLDSGTDPSTRDQDSEDFGLNDLPDSEEDDSFLIKREDSETGEIIDNKVVVQSEKKQNGMTEVDKAPTVKDDISDNEKEKGIHSDQTATVNNAIKESPSEANDLKSNEIVIEKRRSLSRSKKKQNSSKGTVFKSPSLNSGRLNRGKTGKETKNMNSEKTPDMSQLMNPMTDEVTPLVPHTEENLEYTTPQMDEILQQFTLDMVAKAPQKQRQNREETSESQRIQAQLVGRHVNRSLLSLDKIKSTTSPDGTEKSERNDNRKNVKKGGGKRNDKKQMKRNKGSEIAETKDENMLTDDVEETVTKVEETDDYIMEEREHTKSSGKSSKLKRKSDETNSNSKPSSNVHKVARRSRETLEQVMGNGHSNADTRVDNQSPLTDITGQGNTDHNNNTNYDNMAVFDMNPSGDAGGGTFVSYLDFPIHTEVTDMNDHKAGSSPSISGSTGDSISSGVSPQGSPSCSSGPARKRYEKKTRKVTPANPILEKALKQLQLYGAGTDGTYPTDVDTEGDRPEEAMSPGLLSPALSGVSQLSSESSSSRVSHDAFFCAKPPQVTGLDQLFADLTPPDQKTTGLYKTQRFLRGSSSQNNTNFKDFFNDDTSIF